MAEEIRTRLRKGMRAKEIVEELGSKYKKLTSHDVYQIKSKLNKQDGVHQLGRKCGKCGQIGHRRETCPYGRSKEPVEEEQPQEPLGEPLTRIQHRDIQEAREHDMTSSEIAANMAVPLREVNAVMANGSYEDYLTKRSQEE